MMQYFSNCAQTWRSLSTSSACMRVRVCHCAPFRKCSRLMCSVAMSSDQRTPLYWPLATRDTCDSAMSCAHTSAGWCSGMHVSDTSRNMLLRRSFSAASSSSLNAEIRLG